MSGTNEAAVYADQLQNLILRLGRDQEFSILYKEVESMTPIDMKPADFDYKFDCKFMTRLVQPNRLVRPNRIVASFIKAMRGSHVVRMMPAEIKEQSFDIRYGVILNEYRGNVVFSLYLAGGGGFGYINGVHVSIDGQVVRWLTDYCRRNFAY